MAGQLILMGLDYSNLLVHLKGSDLTLFQAINGFCGYSPILDRIARRLDDDQLGLTMFTATFGAIWFERTKFETQRRGTLILMLLAIVFSVILARGFADFLPFRQRPMFTSDIGYRPPLFARDTNYEDWSSFPSDHAAVVFSMTTGFWLLSRWLGLLWASFSIMAMSARVYLGVHYPTDVIFAALIGISVTIALNSQAMHARVASPILSLEKRAPSILYGLLFFFVVTAGSMFGFIRGMFHTILDLYRGL